jgi:hypothetical protein
MEVGSREPPAAGEIREREREREMSLKRGQQSGKNSRLKIIQKF